MLPPFLERYTIFSSLDRRASFTVSIMMKHISIGVIALCCIQTISLALPMLPPIPFMGPMFNPVLPFGPMLGPFMNPMMRPPVLPFRGLNIPFRGNPALPTRNQLGNRGNPPMANRGSQIISRRTSVVRNNRNPTSNRRNNMPVLRSPVRSQKSSTIVTRNTNRNLMRTGSRQLGRL